MWSGASERSGGELDRIKGIGLGLQCEDTEGEYVITMWNGNAQEYQITISIAEGEGENYLFETTDWELEHGKEFIYNGEKRQKKRAQYRSVQII